MNHTLMMLAIGNGVAITMMIFVTPMFIDYTSNVGERVKGMVNDEGKKKIDETTEFYKYVFYIMPISLVNIIIIVMHFYFARYEKELRKRHD